MSTNNTVAFDPDEKVEIDSVAGSKFNEPLANLTCENGNRKAPIKNPKVVTENLYTVWSSLYKCLAKTWKFEHPQLRIKLSPSCIYSIRKNFVHLLWSLHRKGKNGPIIYYHFSQVLLPCARYEGANKEKIEIRLKNRDNTDLIEEIVEGFKNQGVDIEKVGLTDSEQAEFNRKLLDDARSKKAEAEREDRRRKAEQERRQLPPLIEPPSFERDSFLQDPNLALGGVSLDDLINGRTDEDLESDNLNGAPAAGSGNDNGKSEDTPSEDGGLSRAEWREKGLAVFKQANLHEQIWTYVETIAEYFAPIRVTVPPPTKGNPEPIPVLHSVILVASDLEYDFEQNFNLIKPISEALLHVFPLSPEADNAYFYVRGYDTGSFVKIENPSFFSFVGHIVDKQDPSFVLHKSLISEKEDSKKFIWFIRSTDIAFSKALRTEFNRFRNTLSNNATPAVNNNEHNHHHHHHAEESNSNEQTPASSNNEEVRASASTHAFPKPTSKDYDHDDEADLDNVQFDDQDELF